MQHDRDSGEASGDQMGLLSEARNVLRGYVIERVCVWISDQRGITIQVILIVKLLCRETKRCSALEAIIASFMA